MTRKPPSAKSKAAKAKKAREKMGIDRHADVEQRLNEAHERAYPEQDAAVHDTGWIEQSYPSEASLEDESFPGGFTSRVSVADFMTAEEAAAAEEQMLGKRGMPHDDKCSAGKFEGGICSCAAGLNDDVPDFLHNAVKAGPVREPKKVVDLLGRKLLPAPEKERKIADAIALGETTVRQSVIMAGKPKGQRVVTVMRDHELPYPDLYLAVYVAGDWDVRDDEARFARLFARAGCYRAATVEDADLVVFGGGSDVEPLLYGEKNHEKHPLTFYNTKRDEADIKIYLQARNQGIPMMGVCRGAQFLHVMNGGKLYQDVDGHHGNHAGFALNEKLKIEAVSSVHHQAVIHNEEMEVLMVGGKASIRWLNADEKDTKAKMDIEAFYYRDSGCFGVQGHPEYSGVNRYSVWCLEKISDLFLQSPDFEWDGGHVRMTETAKDAERLAAMYVENAYNQSKEA